MTEIILNHGKKATAEIVCISKSCIGQRGKPYRYFIDVRFNYDSAVKGSSVCCATIISYNSKCERYKGSIPIVYVPQYADYLNEYISYEKLDEETGAHRLEQISEMILIEDDIRAHTNFKKF